MLLKHVIFTGLKNHWEKIYATKQSHEVSWTQETPLTSLKFIQRLSLPKSANIIDIGGGDSKLVDSLVDMGYENITILDISEKALGKAKKRLGGKARAIKWVVSDIRDFKPTGEYDLWHDRAAFHFLTSQTDVDNYILTVKSAVKGSIIISTFSKNGPEKCSGLDVTQYNEDQLQRLLAEGFNKVECLTEDHITPFNTKQNFLFCCFSRR